MDFFTNNEFQDILDRVIKDITQNMASIKLYKKDKALSSEICIAKTKFEGGFNATIILCADVSLIIRLAQHVLQEENISTQDIEDFTKEYLNIICGQIVNIIFQTSHIVSRFSIPDIYTDFNLSEDFIDNRFVLNYTSCCNDGIKLIHQIYPLEKQAV